MLKTDSYTIHIFMETMIHFFQDS